MLNTFLLIISALKIFLFEKSLLMGVDPKLTVHQSRA